MTCLSSLVTSRSAYLCSPASGGAQSSPYNWDGPNHLPRYQKAMSPSQSPHPPDRRSPGASPGQGATKSCSAPAADTAGRNTTQGWQGQLAKVHPKAPTSPISALWTHISSHPPPESFKGSGLRGASKHLHLCKNQAAQPTTKNRCCVRSRHLSSCSYSEGELEDQHIISHRVAEHAEDGH